MGLVVAAPSGMGVVLGTAKGGFSAMVGTAISASLLPPLVNCGMMLTIAFLNWHSYGSEHDTILYRNAGMVGGELRRLILIFVVTSTSSIQYASAVQL
jgi:hypothetical protein